MTKISHDDLDKIIRFIKDNFKKRFTDDNINELKKQFCVDLNEVNNKVYWSFNIEFRRGEDQFREGIITKKDYDRLMKSKTYVFSFGEITKHCDLEVEMKEITFSTDKNDVLEFLESKRCGTKLMNYFYEESDEESD